MYCISGIIALLLFLALSEKDGVTKFSACLNQGIIVLPFATYKFLVDNGTNPNELDVYYCLSVDIVLFGREIYPLPYCPI